MKIRRPNLMLFNANTTIVFVLSCLIFWGGIVSSRAELFTPGAWFDSEEGTNTYIETWTLSDQQGFGAALWMEIDLSNPFVPIIYPVNYTIGIGQAWYETVEDTVIDAAFSTNTSAFFKNFGPVESGEIRLIPNLPFFMAFRLGGSESLSGNTYGWAELLWDGSDLHLLDSAAENDGVGIIAGKYEQVPEPSSVLLLTLGSGGILFYRRARRRQQEQHISRRSFQPHK